MNDLRLFADRSAEEIDAIFDAYAERDFEDLPSDIFFSLLMETDDEQPAHYIEIESTRATVPLTPLTDILGLPLLVGASIAL